jgi:hypothetical protein
VEDGQDCDHDRSYHARMHHHQHAGLGILRVRQPAGCGERVLQDDRVRGREDLQEAAPQRILHLFR